MWKDSWAGHLPSKDGIEARFPMIPLIRIARLLDPFSEGWASSIRWLKGRRHTSSDDPKLKDAVW